jgi:hypothetical protein
MKAGPMTRAGALAFAFVIVLATPQALLSQPSGRVSVVGATEYARITEDDGYLGAGFGGAGGLQFHLTKATSVEIEIGRERHIRDLGLFAVAYDAQGRVEAFPFTERWAGTATFVLGLVSRTFGSARVRPVIWGGGGLMSHGGTSRRPLSPPQIPPGFTLQPGDVETRQGRSSKAFAMDGGIGADVALSDRVTVRPFGGLRLVNTGNFGPKYIIRSGARIALHW